MKNMYNFLTVISVLALTLSGCNDRTKKDEHTFKGTKKGQAGNQTIDKMRQDVETILSNYQVNGDLYKASDLEDATSQSALKSLVKVVYYPKACEKGEIDLEVPDQEIELAKDIKSLVKNKEAKEDDKETEQEENKASEITDLKLKKKSKKKEKRASLENIEECIEKTGKYVTTGVVVTNSRTVLTTASQIADIIADNLDLININGSETSETQLIELNKIMSIAIYDENNKLLSDENKIILPRPSELNLFVDASVKKNKLNVIIPGSNYIAIQTAKPVGQAMQIAQLAGEVAPQEEVEKEDLQDENSKDRKITPRSNSTLFQNDEELSLIGYMDSEGQNAGLSDYNLMVSRGKVLNQNICVQTIQVRRNSEAVEDLERIKNDSERFHCLSAPANDFLQGAAIVNKEGHLIGILSGVLQLGQDHLKSISVINTRPLKKGVMTIKEKEETTQKTK